LNKYFVYLWLLKAVKTIVGIRRIDATTNPVIISSRTTARKLRIEGIIVI